MNQKPPVKKPKGSFVMLLLTAVIVLAMVFALKGIVKSMNTPSYSEIIGYFENLQVTEFEFNLGSGLLEYKLEGEEELRSYEVPNVSVFYNELFGEGNIFGEGSNYRVAYDDAHETPLKYNFVPASNTTSILFEIIPLVLMIGMVIFLVVSMTKGMGAVGKANNVGKANVKVDVDGKNKVTFKDVAGADEEKAELQEIVELLKDPKKYQEIGAKIPKGVLLVGPPGTGKTLLAKAVAGEAGVPFLSISGSDFLELYVGVGAARVRDLFDQAKKSAPSIIFIDEIDAVGRRRGAGLGGGHDEREQTLNQLLVEMDGFAANESVIVMAATNRRDVLDPALLRPGRFDRQVYVNYPDIKGREEILKVHTRNKPLAPDVDLKKVAASSVGFTGADLANLVNEAALLAVKNGHKAITSQDFGDAAMKVMVGPEKKSRIVSEEEKHLTAYHEAGHAVCAYYCPTQDKVQEISIIPRGSAGGYTLSIPDQDIAYITKTRMQEDIIMGLGGRAAEKIILDDISTGASNDLQRATKVARNMVTKYGFSDKIGPIVYGTDEDEVFLGRDYNSQKSYSEAIASEIDAEVRAIVHGAYESAIAILSEHVDQLHAVANSLKKREKLSGEEFEIIMKGGSLEDEAEPAEEQEQVVPVTDEIIISESESKSEVESDGETASE